MCVCVCSNVTPPLQTIKYTLELPQHSNIKYHRTSKYTITFFFFFFDNSMITTGEMESLAIGLFNNLIFTIHFGGSL